MEMENQCLEERSHYEKKVTRGKLRIPHYHGRKVRVRRREPVVRRKKSLGKEDRTRLEEKKNQCKDENP